MSVDWGSPWWQHGIRRDGYPAGRVVDGSWTIGLFTVVIDMITFQTQAAIPCCPPSKELVKDVCIGSCTDYGENVVAVDETGSVGDPGDYVAQYACCWCCECLYSGSIIKVDEPPRL